MVRFKKTKQPHRYQIILEEEYLFNQLIKRLIIGGVVGLITLAASEYFILFV